MHDLKHCQTLLALAIAVALGGCSTTPRQLALPEELTVSTTPSPQAAAPVVEVSPKGPSLKDEMYKGSGKFVREATLRAPTGVQDGDVTLNFEETDLREVVKVVIGDVLKQNYVVDPAVKGTISVQTSRPVSKDALLPLMENLLRMSGTALIAGGDGVYRVTPLAGAMRGAAPTLDRRLPPGFRVQVVPVRYIAVQEMQKILEPFVTDGGLLRVDERRNLLVLAGSSAELAGWLATVDTFDVDWLQGYSVGVFPLENADAKTVVGELNKIIGSEAEGMIRLEPIERLNALLVVTPQPSYLERMKEWVDRLDRAGAGPGSRLYVYQVKNRKASELASVIGEIFLGQKRARTEPVRLAPGLQPTQLTSQQGGLSGSGQTGLATQGTGLAGRNTTGLTPLSSSAGMGTSGAYPGSTGLGSAARAGGESLQRPASGESLTVVEGAGVRVVADEANNSILVYASAEDYRVIEQAIKRLDVEPLQVLVEASIVEVTLTDELKYGLEWFFKNNGVVNNRRGEGLLDLNSDLKGVNGSLSAVIPGFSYSLVDSAGAVTAVLNALATDSKINVLSSPSLMVLDNRTAEIRVGDQVPVRLSSQTAYNVSLTQYETYQYRDTGVRLRVTPRVNSGGLVTLEIVQEVTDLGGKDIDSKQYTFLQRAIESVVAVQSGQTIVLGGLIMENNTNREDGIPGLYKVPVVGKLFGATSETTERTELVVMLTPRVVRNQKDAAEITDAFRNRLKRLQPPPQKQEPTTVETKAVGG